MKFKSDNHRKAVFANIFGNNKIKHSKVSSNGVRNFETKSLKTSKTKLSKFKTEQVRFLDVKNITWQVW